MTLKEHTIFKSHLFLTLEEENAWKERNRKGMPGLRLISTLMTPKEPYTTTYKQ